jgi:ABC-type glycerol-3-phosphate transport system permease component
MTASGRAQRDSIGSSGIQVATGAAGSRRNRFTLSKAGLVVLFMILSLLFFVPLYWMVLSSLRPQGSIFGASIDLWPTGMTLDNYTRLLNETPFARWFLNSVTQSLGYATLTVTICALAGFAFAKYRFRGRSVIFWTILGSQMLPFQLLIVPLFVEIVKLGLVETYIGAIVPLAATPIGLFFMRQYMLGLNDELLAAARVDGASEYQLFRLIVLPNIRPALATLFILFSLDYWNNLLWPLIVFRNQNNMPLAVGLASMVNQYKVSYDLLLAGASLATLPVIALFFVLRRQFMAGTAVIGTGAQ